MSARAGDEPVAADEVIEKAGYVGNWQHEAADPECPLFRRYRGESRPNADCQNRHE